MIHYFLPSAILSINSKNKYLGGKQTMLKFIMWAFYNDKIYTTESKLFYKLYKWHCGLFTLLSLRRHLCTIIFFIIGISWLIFIKPRFLGLNFISIAMLLSSIELREIKKFNESGTITPAQKRTLRIEHFIRKIVSTNGRALGRKEWKKIKQYDIDLYNYLLCNKCHHCCYVCSLEIAKIIKDSILVWGAIEEPFEDGHNYYAHTVILRNGYIYDSNRRQSDKYENFIKFYKFKLYKQWKYDEYSQRDFRESERADFRKWCKENNVLAYEKF